MTASTNGEFAARIYLVKKDFEKALKQSRNQMIFEACLLGTMLLVFGTAMFAAGVRVAQRNELQTVTDFLRAF